MGILSLFEQKKKPVLGLDVSSTTVKLLEFSRQGDGYRVENYAVRALPPNSVVEKNINDVEAVAQVIKAVVQTSRTKVKDVAVAVPGSSVITKVIEMAGGVGEEALESQISLEADQYIPYPLEEVAIDFDILGPFSRKFSKLKIFQPCRQNRARCKSKRAKEQESQFSYKHNYLFLLG